MFLVELAVVFLVALVIAGGIIVWHTGKESRAGEEPSLGQNDLQKSSTER